MRLHAAIAMWLSAAAPGAMAQEVLLDQIRLNAYDVYRGNAIGGDNLFGADQCYALQISDDFRTTATGYIVTEVQVANAFLEGFHDVRDARVSFYEDLGGYPSEMPAFSERVSAMTPGPASVRPRFHNEEFFDHVGSITGVLTTITGLWIRLEPETGYFVCVQVDAGPDNWAYTCLEEDDVSGSESYTRDGPPQEGCLGAWGHTIWHPMSDLYDPADANYRVVAISRPPPRPDFDGDGAVTADDLVGFIRAWVSGEGDADGDGDTDAADFASFVSAWAEDGGSASRPIKE